MINRVKVFWANHVVDKHPPTTRDYIEVTVAIPLMCVAAFLLGFYWNG